MGLARRLMRRLQALEIFTSNLLHTLDNPNAYGTSTSDYFGRYR